MQLTYSQKTFCQNFIIRFDICLNPRLINVLSSQETIPTLIVSKEIYNQNVPCRFYPKSHFLGFNDFEMIFVLDLDFRQHITNILFVIVKVSTRKWKKGGVSFVIVIQQLIVSISIKIRKSSIYVFVILFPIYGI